MDYPLLWIIIAVVYTNTECCEREWVLYERLNVCYKLFKTPKLDWRDARDFCAKQNAKLADLYDYDEQMFIKEKLLKKATNGHGIWVGASDIAIEDDWRWLDNTKLDTRRFVWWEGNPDNGDSFLDLILSEDCLEISLKRSHRGRLNDFKCMTKMPFLCKQKVISTTSTSPKTRSIMTEQNRSSESRNTSTIPIVSVLVSLFLAAILVAGITLYIRRYRKKKHPSNYYEDAHVTPSANENLYTCLDTTNQSNCRNNSACAVISETAFDQNSIHEYQSVHFSTEEANYGSVIVKRDKMNNAGTRYYKPSTQRKY